MRLPLPLRTWIISHKRSLQSGAVILVGIFFWSAIGSYWTSFIHAFRLVVASIFVFLLPGWWMTRFFFPHSERIIDDRVQEGMRQRRSLDLIERATLAVIISIIISSAVVFILNAVSADALTPRNLVLAMGSTNLILWAVAAWQKHRIWR